MQVFCYHCCFFITYSIPTLAQLPLIPLQFNARKGVRASEESHIL